MLFYEQAERHQALKRADSLDELSITFTGKPSDIAKEIRRAYG